MGDLFYVYEHWRPDRGECFYVGKGKGRRANDMRRGRNRHHKAIQAKLSHFGFCVEVRLVATGLAEADAFALEIERIAFWRNDGADLANLTDGGDGPSGRKHTEAWKKAQSIRAKGRVVSDETRAKLSEAAKGNQRGLGTKKSPEAVEKTRQAHLGRKVSEETRQRMRAAKQASPSFKGQHHTPETIEVLRAKNTGRVRSEETRAKMRKPKSEEHKRKLSEINTGKTHTEETRKLLSEKAKADWAKRKLLKSTSEVTEK